MWVKLGWGGVWVRAQVVAVDVVDVLAVGEEQLLLQRLAGVITR